MHSSKSASSKGFTLIELLIVIGIIGFLAAAVLVAVDPVKRIQDSRDARQFSEVNGLLNAILNKQVDDRLLFNGDADTPIIDQTVTNQVQVIVSVDGTATTCSVVGTKPMCGPGAGTGSISYTGVSTATDDCVANLADLVPTYIASLPITPALLPAGTTGPALGTTNTGYFIRRTAGNRVEIGGCWPEQSGPISVKR